MIALYIFIIQWTFWDWGFDSDGTQRTTWGYITVSIILLLLICVYLVMVPVSSILCLENIFPLCHAIDSLASKTIGNGWKGSILCFRGWFVQNILPNDLLWGFFHADWSLIILFELIDKLLDRVHSNGFVLLQVNLLFFFCQELIYLIVLVQ